MRSSNKRELKIEGWCELLFRKRPLKLLDSEDAIHDEDYESMVGALPIAEFVGPFSVYETFCSRSGSRRAVREYDIINIIMTSPGKSHVSLLLISESTSKNSHLRYPKVHTERHDDFSLTLLGLRKKVKSFHGKKN